MMRYLIVVGSTLAGGGLLQLNTTVPSSLLSGVGRSPIEFIVLLAEASVPSGLEIREPGDSHARPVPYSDSDSGRRVPATQLTAAFNAAHSDYKAALMNGV